MLLIGAQFFGGWGSASAGKYTVSGCIPALLLFIINRLYISGAAAGATADLKKEKTKELLGVSRAREPSQDVYKKNKYTLFTNLPLTTATQWSLPVAAPCHPLLSLEGRAEQAV